SLGPNVRECVADRVDVISSARGVQEARAAADLCSDAGIPVGVVDMPSIDEELLLALYDSSRLLRLAEQNDCSIHEKLIRHLQRHRASAGHGLANVMPINTLRPDGRPQFIHPGTYEELIEAFGLTPSAIAAAITARLDDGTHARPEGGRR